ncbi:MAG: DNA replication/repair protein RecF [Nitrosarchaeum sp.]|nr:DNA replication/repair protein RecF [Nitrosarchaeum sp.]
MFLKSLYLKNFRNYEEAFVEFSPNLNFIYGDNAEGKTNLLEALFLISSGKSFRTTKLSELIRSGADAFILAAEIKKQGVLQTLEIHCNGIEKYLTLNATSYRSFTPLLGLLPHVLFIPEAIQFIQGPPVERRRFLDFHLAQSDPLYVHHFLRFAKAMKQRNQLLRCKDITSIQSWEHIIAYSAAYLVSERKKAIEDLRPKVQESLHQLSQSKETLQILYKPSLTLPEKIDDLADRIQYRLERLREKEIALGYTLTGPHRDDIGLLLQGKEVRDFASEGQKRSCLVALRLAEWKRLHYLTDVSPLLSIDDFSSHLDATRQSFLEQQMNTLSQVFITSPYAPTNKMAELAGKVLHVSSGCL